MAAPIDMSRIPYIPGRIHATNHPYLYVRVDLPGVPDDAIRYRVDAVRQKVVFFSGEETLSRDGYNAGDVVREYSGTAGLGCDCCEITGVDAKMKDGVLRMILSRVKVKVRDHDNNKCTHFLPPNAGKSGRYDVNSSNWVEVVEDHPYVVKGRKDTLATKRTSDGSFHPSVDMPGVCMGDMLVIPNENEIKFYGENKEVYEHDESCRIFLGAINNRQCCSQGIPLLRHNIAWYAEFGVLKVCVSPPTLSSNIN